MKKESFGTWLKRRGFKLENILPGLDQWELVPPIPENTVTLTEFIDEISHYTPTGTSHEMLYSALQSVFDDWLRGYLANEPWVNTLEKEDVTCF